MLTVSGVSKSYGQVPALSQVSCAFSPGEIHAVLGENGAGKSTLVGVLAGFVVPDSGRVEFDGKPIPFGRPFDCKRLGIAMIHQHFTLVPQFTVAENLALARSRSGVGPLDLDLLARPALQLARQLGWDVEPGRRTHELSVGAKQRLEILKALSEDAAVVIFDEPTAVLGGREVKDLFRVLRELKGAGKTIILIAHKLSEVMAIADRVTVLRKGSTVAERSIEDVEPRQLAEWMVGEIPASSVTSSPSLGDEILRLQNLVVLGDRREDAVKGISLSIRRGEILGIGGVDGNGQVELAEAMAGIRPVEAGTRELNPSHARIGFVPQDRQRDGLALTLSVADNLLIGGFRRSDLSYGPMLKAGRIRRWADRLVREYGIKVGQIDDPVGGLSGGNQQKVVVSRTLDASPDALIVVNPTRGLDLKAAEFVHRSILAARDQGAAVALFSTDLDELAALANRRVYMSRGQFVDGEDAAALLGGAD